MFELLDWYTRKLQRRKVLDKGKGDIYQRLATLLLHPRFRKGEIFVGKTELAGRIRAGVKRSGEINLLLPILPGKNQNSSQVRGYLPDLGEAATLERLSEIVWQLSQVIQVPIYFTIVEDGLFFADIFGENQEWIKSYSQHLKVLVRDLGIEDAVKFFDIRQLTEGNSAYWTEVRRLQQQLTETVTREQGRSMLQFLSGGTLRDGMRCFVSYRSRVLAWYSTELLEAKFPFAIRTTDRPKPGMVAFHLIDKEIETFPWYGVPVLSSNGRLKIWTQQQVDEKGLPYEGYFGEDIPFVYLMNGDTPIG